jgi:hypothetical protein
MNLSGYLLRSLKDDELIEYFEILTKLKISIDKNF